VIGARYFPCLPFDFIVVCTTFIHGWYKVVGTCLLDDSRARPASKIDDSVIVLQISKIPAAGFANLFQVKEGA
jgi:hypothetical protein